MGISKLLLPFGVVLVLLLIGCAKPIRFITIQVSNDTSVDRDYELIELNLSDIAPRLIPTTFSQLEVRNSDNLPISHQITHDGKLVFPVEVKAHSKKCWYIAVKDSKISGKFIPKPNFATAIRILGDSVLRSPKPWVAYTILDNGPLRYSVKTGYAPMAHFSTNIIETRTIQLDAGSDTPRVATAYTCLPPSRIRSRQLRSLKIEMIE